MEQFQYPRTIRWDEKTYTQFYGRLVVESLERGYATTLGNSLRRVLLSSIGGVALTAVKIEGVPHEFSTIPGVVEDVTDVVMNLKQVYLKSNITEIPDFPFRVEIEGPSEVVADHLFPGPEMTVLNPLLHIATLGEGSRLVIELTVSRGFGYVPVSRMSSEATPIGTIPLAASFSPVTRVKLHNENTRVGQRVDYEKLTMEIWTNGAVAPREAVEEASRILVRHCEAIISPPVPALETARPGTAEAGPESAGAPADEGDLSGSGLSTRTVNVLKSAGVATIGELSSRTRKEVGSLPGVGPKAVEEICAVLSGMGLGLKEDK